MQRNTWAWQACLYVMFLVLSYDLHRIAVALERIAAHPVAVNMTAPQKTVVVRGLPRLEDMR